MRRLILALMTGLLFLLDSNFPPAGPVTTYAADTNKTMARDQPCCACTSYPCKPAGCKCCVCGVRAKITRYNNKTGNGTLQMLDLRGQPDSMKFTVPQDLRGNLKTLSDVGKEDFHLLSLKFPEEGTPQCVGIDENLSDRTASVRMAREVMSILKNIPTYAPDHPSDKPANE